MLFFVIGQWSAGAISKYNDCVTRLTDELSKIRNIDNKGDKCTANKEIVLEHIRCSLGVETQTHFSLSWVKTFFAMLNKGDAPPYSAIRIHNDSCVEYPKTLIEF